jgi:hypothetical protein
MLFDPSIVPRRRPADFGTAAPAKISSAAPRIDSEIFASYGVASVNRMIEGATPQANSGR